MFATRMSSNPFFDFFFGSAGNAEQHGNSNQKEAGATALSSETDLTDEQIQNISNALFARGFNSHIVEPFPELIDFALPRPFKNKGTEKDIGLEANEDEDQSTVSDREVSAPTEDTVLTFEPSSIATNAGAFASPRDLDLVRFTQGTAMADVAFQNFDIYDLDFPAEQYGVPRTSDTRMELASSPQSMLAEMALARRVASALPTDLCPYFSPQVEGMAAGLCTAVKDTLQTSIINMRAQNVLSSRQAARFEELSTGLEEELQLLARQTMASLGPDALEEGWAIATTISLTRSSDSSGRRRGSTVLISDGSNDMELLAGHNSRAPTELKLAEALLINQSEQSRRLRKTKVDLSVTGTIDALVEALTNDREDGEDGEEGGVLVGWPCLAMRSATTCQQLQAAASQKRSLSHRRTSSWDGSNSPQLAGEFTYTASLGRASPQQQRALEAAGPPQGRTRSDSSWRENSVPFLDPTGGQAGEAGGEEAGPEDRFEQRTYSREQDLSSMGAHLARAEEEGYDTMVVHMRVYRATPEEKKKRMQRKKSRKETVEEVVPMPNVMRFLGLDAPEIGKHRDPRQPNKWEQWGAPAPRSRASSGGRTEPPSPAASEPRAARDHPESSRAAMERPRTAPASRARTAPSSRQSSRGPSRGEPEPEEPRELALRINTPREPVDGASTATTSGPTRKREDSYIEQYNKYNARAAPGAAPDTPASPGAFSLEAALPPTGWTPPSSPVKRTPARPPAHPGPPAAAPAAAPTPSPASPTTSATSATPASATSATPSSQAVPTRRPSQSNGHGASSPLRTLAQSSAESDPLLNRGRRPSKEKGPGRLCCMGCSREREPEFDHAVTQLQRRGTLDGMLETPLLPQEPTPESTPRVKSHSTGSKIKKSLVSVIDKLSPGGWSTPSSSSSRREENSSSRNGMLDDRVWRGEAKKMSEAGIPPKSDAPSTSKGPSRRSLNNVFKQA